jgi:hypothetical protein
LAYIPFGVLEKIKKKHFKLLRIGEKDKEYTPLAQWKIITKPKDEGGWGLKNIHFFEKPLDPNSL